MTNQNLTRSLKKAAFRVPAMLFVLSLVPILGGVARLKNLSSGAAVTAENARFSAAPVPIVIHVITATLFCVLGAFQFSAGFRFRWPSWHRRAGRFLVLCGVLAGITGLWMTALYRIPTNLQGPMLYWVRLVVASAMVASIVIAVLRILRRDVASHEAFMIRAYALGQGAGTQVLILGPWMLFSGETGGLTRDLLMTLAWTINLIVAEWIIKRRAKPSPHPRTACRKTTWNSLNSRLSSP